MKAIINVIDDDGKLIVENKVITPKSEHFYGISRISKFEFEIHECIEVEKNKCTYPKDDMRYRFCKGCEMAYICKFNET